MYSAAGSEDSAGAPGLVVAPEGSAEAEVPEAEPEEAAGALTTAPSTTAAGAGSTVAREIQARMTAR